MLLSGTAPALLALVLTTGPAAAQDRPSLVDLVDRYCIQPDGDHRMTWQRAERDGFEPISPETVNGLRLPGGAGRNLRGFTKDAGSIQLRVLTSANQLIAPDDGAAFFRRCWVSASSGDAEKVIRSLRLMTEVPSFRSGRTTIFAWIPRPSESREAVSRRIFMRHWLTLSRQQGMRHLAVATHQNAVIIGYASPRDEATYRDFDWSGPEPVPR